MPTVGMPLQKRPRNLRHHVELFKIEFLPRNRRIRLQTGFALFAGLVNRRVNLLQLTAGGIRYDLRPRFVGFTESYRISMTRATISSQGLVGNLSNVWSSHYYRNTRGTDGVSHAISSRHHSRHRANTNEANFFFNYKVYQLPFVHWPRIAIDQQYFMFSRG